MSLHFGLEISRVFLALQLASRSKNAFLGSKAIFEMGSKSSSKQKFFCLDELLAVLGSPHPILACQNRGSAISFIAKSGCMACSGSSVFKFKVYEKTRGARAD